MREARGSFAIRHGRALGSACWALPIGSGIRRRDRSVQRRRAGRFGAAADQSRRSRADGMHGGITIKYLKGERWIIRNAVDNLNRMNQELAKDNHTRNGDMKIHGIIAMMVAILFATMASAQSPNNAVWGVNDQNQVFRWNSSRNEFEVMPGISLKQVSVGTDGEVWGIDPDDSVYRWTGSQWQQVQGMKIKQLSVRNGQEVWGVVPTTTSSDGLAQPGNL